jgi:glycosyltransferase involved in cell wall biosynthesis
MRIRFVTASVSRDAGGLFESVRRLAQATTAETHDVVVFGVEDTHTGADIAAWSPLEIRVFKSIGPRRFSFAPRLGAALLSSQGNLVMSHGLWRYTSKATHTWHKQTGLPYIVNPHGMLDSWAIKNSRWKKRVASFLYEDAHLRYAACIRALCESEAQSIRAYGLRNPICVIPNGIDLPPVVDGLELRVDGPFSRTKERGCKVLLYLGRIHPKKGLVNLLKAWAEVQRSEVRGQKSDWVLAVAGWDEGGHEAELKRLATELGIQWTEGRGQTSAPLDGIGVSPSSKIGGHQPADFSVSAFQLSAFSLLFLGPQFGEEKAACYRACDAFILPSFSEGLPMVILEAWAHAKPVLMTPECNLPEGFAAEAAVRIGADVESISQALGDLFRTPHSALRAMGAAGRGLVATRFAWPGIGHEMRAVCAWVLGQGPKPVCVRLD